MLRQYLKADFMKTKRLSLRMAHILVPIGAVLLFTFYYTYSPWSEYVKLKVFYQVLGMALPVLISVFCAMVSEQEHSAGSFQAMLMVRKKCVPFLSKLMVLLLLELGALLAASTLFGVGFRFALNNDVMPIGFYFLMSFVLMGSSMILYILHLFLAFHFNKGLSMGLGIMESLVAALFLTDMGKYAWHYVPASWPARLSTTFLSAYTGDTAASVTLHTMIPFCAVSTVIVIVLYIFWASRWEGAQTHD